MDKLSFLDGETPEQTAAPTPETPAPEPVAQTAPPEGEPQGQPRGPDGKFASKAPEASATPAPEPQAPATPPEAVTSVAEPVKAPDGYVPIGVVQELRREIQALKLQPQQPPPTRYQPGEEGYEEEQNAIRYEALIAGRARVQVARSYAVKAHGEEAVEAALEWARQRADYDQNFAVQAQSAEDPVAFAMEEHEYHQALGKLRDPQARANFMAFLNGQAAAPQAQPAAAPSVAPPPQPSAPPQSMASAPNAGGAKPGAQPSYPGAAFDSVFRN
jgi:hypothetical protein